MTPQYLVNQLLETDETDINIDFLFTSKNGFKIKFGTVVGKTGWWYVVTRSFDLIVGIIRCENNLWIAETATLNWIYPTRVRTNTFDEAFNFIINLDDIKELNHKMQEIESRLSPMFNIAVRHVTLLLWMKILDQWSPVAELHPTTIDAIVDNPKLKELPLIRQYSNYISTEPDGSGILIKINTPDDRVFIETSFLDASPWLVKSCYEATRSFDKLKNALDFVTKTFFP